MVKCHKVIILKLEIIIIYFVAINYISVFLCAFDKRQAKLYKRRVSENTLLLTSAMGGSIAMYIVMRSIRHKTRKKKFMVGLPVMIAVQLLIASYFILYR